MIGHSVVLLTCVVARLAKILQLALVLPRVLHLAAVDLLYWVLAIGVPLVTRVPHLVLVRVEVVALALPLAHESLARLCHVLHVLLPVFGVVFTDGVNGL